MHVIAMRALVPSFFSESIRKGASLNEIVDLLEMRLDNMEHTIPRIRQGSGGMTLPGVQRDLATVRRIEATLERIAAHFEAEECLATAETVVEHD